MTVVTNNSDLIPRLIFTIIQRILYKNKSYNIKLNRLKSQFTTTVRANYSNPPAHGARIAAAIFNNKALNDEWLVHIILINVQCSI